MIETFIETVFIHILQKNLKKHKDACENHDYCLIEMPKKIIKY